MKKNINYKVRQIKNQAAFIALALACVVCACGQTNTPLPVAVADKTQPAAASPAMQSGEIFNLAILMNSISTNEFPLSSEGGWDKFTIPKVQKWVQENLYGKKASMNVCMPQCNVTQEDATSKPDEWTVSLQVAGIHANHAGIANRILLIDKEDSRMPYLDKENPNAPAPNIGVKDNASFTFKCTEAEARKWDAYSKTPASAVTVEGNVVGIYFLPHLDVSLGDFIGYDIFVQLENVAITQSKDTEPSAIYACEYNVLMMARDGLADVPDEAITKMKRLDNNGDYQLIFLKYNEWRSGKRNVAKLLSFNFSGTKIMFTPCGDPPTASEIAAARTAVTWPKNK